MEGYLMIDFEAGALLKLKWVPADKFEADVAPLLIPDEKIIAAFVTVRDGVVFTNKRIIAINVQGITGKKKDFTSMPYSKIQVYSVESAGVLDMDSELELWFSGVGKIKFEFVGNANVSEICKMISIFALN